MEKHQQALRGKHQPVRKAPKKQQTQEKHADPAYQAVLAMLDSASASLLGQLPGERLLTAAGSLGNQAILAALSDQTDGTEGLRETAAILGGASVPSFGEDMPVNSVTPAAELAPAPVPAFGFFGGQPVSFEAVLDMAVDLGG